MNNKTRYAIIFIMLFALVTIAGGVYTYYIQGKEIKQKEAEAAELRKSYASIEVLNKQIDELEKTVVKIDSALFTGKFTVPQNLSQSDFFQFVDRYSKDYSSYTYTNVEYVSSEVENGFNYYLYKVSGNGDFNDVYGLVYAIEHSREFKKIENADLKATISTDTRNIPRYLVDFSLEVKVYYSASGLYAAVNKREYDLSVPRIYNAFYPLIRDEVRPNTSNLPDIQNGTLVSLIPQGAFVTDSKGNTLLLTKGDKVYLGYLMDIDYEKEEVTFILNKGGIIEYKVLKLGR